MSKIPVKLLTFKEVSEKINIKKYSAVQEWLKNKGITSINSGGRPMYSDFVVEVAQHKDILYTLKNAFPENWQRIYEATSTDEKFTKAVLASFGDETIVQKVQRQSITANKKDYLNFINEI